MYVLILCGLLVLIVLAFERFYLRGNQPKDYPRPDDPDAIRSFPRPQGPGEEHENAVRFVRQMSKNISPAIRNHKLAAAREEFESISKDRKYISEFRTVDAGGVPAEWVLAPGGVSSRRLLYIHGGAFMLGSPKSHRTITSKFSEICGCAVLAIDYRLLPEHRHMDCVEDCRSAYHWILNNGPDGPEDVQQLYMAGDSAGGNLVLSLMAWIRDNNYRAPQAVIAFSPLTDSTFSGDSIHDNAATDVMLGAVIKPLRLLPPFVRSWWIVWTHRLRPANPVASPLLGDLSGLPPTLIQASESEMLLDDARRYVFKACASGSPAKLQTWADMLHVWQIFYPEIPQAVEAWAEIEDFLKVHSEGSL